MARSTRLNRGGVRSPLRSAADMAIFLVLLAMALVGLRLSGLLGIPDGPVKVIDGDSLRRGDIEIRLSGIDAPEFLQTCQDENEQDRYDQCYPTRSPICIPGGNHRHKLVE